MSQFTGCGLWNSVSLQHLSCFFDVTLTCPSMKKIFKKMTHMSEFVGTNGSFSHPVTPTVPQIHAETQGAEQRALLISPSPRRARCVFFPRPPPLYTCALARAHVRTRGDRPGDYGPLARLGDTISHQPCESASGFPACRIVYSAPLCEKC